MKIEILKELGLSENESLVYITLLKEKSCNASRLAKLAKINRSTVYLELDNLKEKGLVSYLIKNSKRFYFPSDPEKFIEILNEKKEKFENILPQLKELHKSIDPFKIEIFEGKEGIKTFYQDIYSTVKEFFVIGATGKAGEILKFEYPHLVKKFLKSNIKEKALANISAKAFMESHPSANLEIKYIPKKYEAKVTTIIYENKIALQSLQENSIYVVLIKDEFLYQTYKNQFDLLWSFL